MSRFVALSAHTYGAKQMQSVIITNLISLPEEKYQTWQLDTKWPILQTGNEIILILIKNKKAFQSSLFTVRWGTRGTSTCFVPVSNGCITFGTLVTT